MVKPMGKVSTLCSTSGCTPVWGVSAPLSIWVAAPLSIWLSALFPPAQRLLRLHSHKPSTALNPWLSHKAALQPQRGKTGPQLPSEGLEISRMQEGLSTGNFIRPAQSNKSFLSLFLLDTPCPSVLPHPLWVLPCPPVPAVGRTKGKPHQLSSEERAGPHPAFPRRERAGPFGNGTKNSLFLFAAKGEGTSWGWLRFSGSSQVSAQAAGVRGALLGSSFGWMQREAGRFPDGCSLA